MGDVEVLDALPPMRQAFASALLPRRAGGTPTIPDVTARVEHVETAPERLADYARVCGFTDTAHLPPTWIHVLTFPLHVHLLSHRRSSIRLVGAVHVSNEMTLLAPVPATTPLTLSVRLDDLRAHRRGALVDLLGEAHADGELVWQGVSTYLAPGIGITGEPQETPRATYEPAAPEALWELHAGLGRDYRRVSGDPNPIHTSRLAARIFGFSRPIIHGMWTHAHALAAMPHLLPETYTARVAFTRPIALPATVGFTCTTVDASVQAAVTTRDGAKAHLTMSVSPHH